MAVAAVDIVLNLKDNASGPLGKISGALGHLGERAGSAAGTLAKIGAGAAIGGIAAVGTGIIGAAVAGLRFNNTLEQTRAKMVAFTGSNEEAAKILEQVEARASKTPFAFGEMADAAAAFLPLQKQTGIGWEKYAEQAEVLAALNPAEGLAGAAFALREAAGGDFLSIVERFNLPKKRLMELKAEGVPALEAVKIALAEMGVDTSLVAGLAETAEGRWSTFKDTLTSLAATGTGKVFEQLSGSLGKVNTALVENAPQLEAFAVAIGERLGTAMTWLITNIPTIIGQMQSFWAATEPLRATVISLATEGFAILQQAIAAAMPILQQIAATVMPMLQQGFQAIQPVLQTAAQIFATVAETIRSTIAGFLEEGAFIGIENFAAGIASLAAQFGIAQPTVAAIESAINLFGQRIVAAYDAMLPFIQQAIPLLQTGIQTLVSIALPLIQTMVDTWVERFNTLLGIVQSVWPSIQSIIETVVGVIGTFLQQHGAEIVTTLQGAWTTVQGAINTVITVIGSIVQTVFSVVASFLKGHSSEIQSVLTLAWETIKVVIQGATAIIEGIILPVFKGIATFLADHKTEILTILETAWSLIRVAIETTLGVIQGIVKTVMALIKGDWQGAWDEIKGIVDTIWTGIQETAQIGVDTVKGIVASIGPRVQELAGEFKTKALALGSALIDGILAGLSGLAEKAKQKIIGGISGGIEGVKSFFGIGSPSKYTAKEIGAPLAEGILMGFVDVLSNIRSVITGSLRSTFEEAVIPATTSVRNAIRDLLKTGDFRGGIFGLQEDDPFITWLLTIRTDAENAAAVLRVLEGGIWGIETAMGADHFVGENDPFVQTLKQAASAATNTAKAIPAVNDAITTMIEGLHRHDITPALLGALKLEEDDPIVSKIFETANRWGQTFLTSLEYTLKTGDLTPALLSMLGIHEDDPIAAALVAAAQRLGGNVGEAIGAGLQQGLPKVMTKTFAEITQVLHNARDLFGKRIGLAVVDGIDDYLERTGGARLRQGLDDALISSGTLGDAAAAGQRVGLAYVAGINDILERTTIQTNRAFGGSTDFMDFAKITKGSASAAKTAGATIGRAIVDGVKEALEKLPPTALDIFKDTISKLSNMGSVFGGLGNAAATRYKDQFLTPLQAQLKRVDDQLAALDEQLQGSGITGEAAIPFMEQRNRLLDEQLRLEQEEFRIQSKLAELQRQQQDLSFLQQQAKLLELIQQHGLDPRAILGDLRLGLGASVEGLLDAMTRALQGVVGQMQAAVGGTDVSLRPSLLSMAPTLALAPATVPIAAGPINVTIVQQPWQDTHALTQEVIYQIRREQRTVR